MTTPDSTPELRERIIAEVAHAMKHASKWPLATIQLQPLIDAADAIEALIGEAVADRDDLITAVIPWIGYEAHVPELVERAHVPELVERAMAMVHYGEAHHQREGGG